MGRVQDVVFDLVHPGEGFIIGLEAVLYLLPGCLELAALVRIGAQSQKIEGILHRGNSRAPRYVVFILRKRIAYVNFHPYLVKFLGYRIVFPRLLKFYRESLDAIGNFSGDIGHFPKLATAPRDALQHPAKG